MLPIYVEWLDSETTDDWMSTKEAHDNIGTEDMPTIKTIGWLVKETKNNILICMNWDTSNDNVRSTIKIPKIAVISRRDLNV